MDDRRVVGKLTINLEDDPIDLDILSGILDRSYSAFDFESGKKRDIDGYNLTVDVSNVGKQVLRDLHEVTNTMDKMYNVILQFEGENKHGTARIAENMGFTGFSLDLELHN